MGGLQGDGKIQEEGRPITKRSPHRLRRWHISSSVQKSLAWVSFGNAGRRLNYCLCRLLSRENLCWQEFIRLVDALGKLERRCKHGICAVLMKPRSPGGYWKLITGPCVSNRGRFWAAWAHSVRRCGLLLQMFVVAWSVCLCQYLEFSYKEGNM